MLIMLSSHVVLFTNIFNVRYSMSCLLCKSSNNAFFLAEKTECFLKKKKENSSNKRREQTRKKKNIRGRQGTQPKAHYHRSVDKSRYRYAVTPRGCWRSIIRASTCYNELLRHQKTLELTPSAPYYRGLLLTIIIWKLLENAARLQYQQWAQLQKNTYRRYVSTMENQCLVTPDERINHSNEIHLNLSKACEPQYQHSALGEAALQDAKQMLLFSIYIHRVSVRFLLLNSQLWKLRSPRELRHSIYGDMWNKRQRDNTRRTKLLKMEEHAM